MSKTSRFWWVNSADAQGFIDFYTQQYKAQPTAVEVAAMRADIAQQRASVANNQQKEPAPQAKGKPMRYAYLNDKASYGAEYLPIESDDYAEGKTENDSPTVSSAGIGILRLSGYLTKQETFMNWLTGTACVDSLLADLNLFAEDERVKGVAIYVDSPGGEVKGIEELANTIRGFYARCKKRVQAYIDGCACSAAYWAISGADRIVLVGNSSNVGSIGTMVSIVDSAEYEARLGIVVRNIYATLSTEKNKAYEAAKEGDDEPMRAMLDKYNSVFIGDVIRGRYRNSLKVENLTPENAPEQFKGGLYFGRDAVAVGLADGVVPTKADALDAFVFLLQTNGAAAGVEAGSGMRKDKEQQGSAAGDYDKEYDDDDDDDGEQEPYAKIFKKAMQYKKDKKKQGSASAEAQPIEVTQPAQDLLPIRALTQFKL